jgi:hypothetical protein
LATLPSSKQPRVVRSAALDAEVGAPSLEAEI